MVVDGGATAVGWAVGTEGGEVEETAPGGAAGAVDALDLGGGEGVVGVAEEEGGAAGAEADLGPGVDEEGRVEGWRVGVGVDEANVTGGVGIRDEVQVVTPAGGPAEGVRGRRGDEGCAAVGTPFEADVPAAG